MDRSQTTPAPAAQSSLLSRRRKSLPSRAHRANPSTVDTASPEVISSLISSLSTISVPLQSHFDSFPRIDSDTVPPWTAPLPPDPSPLDRVLSDHGPGLSNGASNAAEERPHSPFLHPDDAAASPVIRMARAPPSPKAKSPRSPKSPKSPRFPSAADRPPSRPISRASYTSSKAEYEDSAFGMITAEPGPPPRVSTAPSIASASSGRRKSLKGQLGMLKGSSRELPSSEQREAERLRKTSSYNDSLRHDDRRSRVSLRSMHSMADLAEEGRPSTVDVESETENSAPGRHSPRSAREEKTTGPAGIGGGRTIPARDSSLRHSFSSSPKRHRSARHSRYSSTGSKDTRADGSPDADNEEEQVTKRIQEVKDQRQKIRTELEIDNSPRKPVTPEPSKQALVDSGDRRNQDRVNSVSGDRERSAPSPSIMTGKSRARAQPQAARQSLEKSDRSERTGRPRRSVEPSTPTGRHRRLPSSQFSPDHGSMADERRLSVDSLDLAVSDYISSPKLTQKVSHPATGRVIAFSEVGDPKGHVVLCCVGMGLTRYLMAFYDELARTLKLRLITLDRPGIGESEPYADGSGAPLTWPDDVAIVCNHLRVTKFSLLAHSAGAIYALATALRIPQHIRGRLHLLAPWIPPSQLSAIGSQKAPVPANAVPYSQRILRALPTPFLKVANSSFLSTTSASITGNLPKSSRRKRKATMKEGNAGPAVDDSPRRAESKTHHLKADLQATEPPVVSNAVSSKNVPAKGEAIVAPSQDQERQTEYDTRLTHKVWELATTKANAAVDLMTCLERRQSIGFQYVDITRSVVIHHGSRDTRVPVDNVRWLGKTMRRCEVRVLEGEGHGLMASAAVMGNVLMEIAKEWEDWMIVVHGKRRATVTHGTQSRIPIQT